MRSLEIVLNEPFGQPVIKYRGVSDHVTQGKELILEGTIEPLIDCIVLWCFGPGPVVGEVKGLAGGIEMPMKLTPIVSLNIFDLSVKEEMEAVEKILRRAGAVGFVHPSKSNLGMPVNGSEDIPLLSLPVSDHSIQAEQEPRERFSLQFRDFLPGSTPCAFLIDSGLFWRVVVQAGSFDDALNLPGRHSSVSGVFLPVELQQFHLAIAQVRLPQLYDIVVLTGGVRTGSHTHRSPGFVFQPFQEVFLEPSHPLVEGLPANAKVPGSERGILSVLLVENHPFKAASGSPGQAEELCHFSPAVVAGPEFVFAMEVLGISEGEQPTLLLFIDGQRHRYAVKD